MDCIVNDCKPAISIVLPVYNCESYVADAIQSILNQSFANFELIIINDGSTDGSGSIARHFKELDARVIIIEQENKGLVFSLNKGIEIAQAEYIARMDADDISMPNRLKLQYEKMNEDSQIAVLGSFTKIIDEHGQEVGLGFYPVHSNDVTRLLYRGSPVAHPAVMMRKKVVQAVGGYREKFLHCEDYDLWLRIIETGYVIANLPKLLLKYRVHTNNISFIHRQQQEINSNIAILTHRIRCMGYPDPLIGVDHIKSDFVDSLDSDLKRKVNSDLFVLRHLGIANYSNEALLKAWNEFLSLSLYDRARPIIYDFLISFLRVSLRRGLFLHGVNAFLIALRLNPVGIFGSLLSKFKLTFLILICNNR